jgi:hypothetical protein
MDSSYNIFCKIELIKNTKQSLNMNIHINPEAPNINQESNSVTWTPTKEEQEFLMDVLLLINDHKNNKHITFSKKDKNLIDSIESNKKTMDTSIEQTIEKHLESKRKPIEEEKYKAIEKIIT